MELEVQHAIYTIPPTATILGQINPGYAFSSYLLEINFNV
jgi:hypothetical protein